MWKLQRVSTSWLLVNPSNKLYHQGDLKSLSPPPPPPSWATHSHTRIHKMTEPGKDPNQPTWPTTQIPWPPEHVEAGYIKDKTCTTYLRRMERESRVYSYICVGVLAAGRRTGCRIEESPLLSYGSVIPRGVCMNCSTVGVILRDPCKVMIPLVTPEVSRLGLEMDKLI